MNEIYFDNSATTCAYDAVIAAVCTAMSNDYGNPSSSHKKGLEAERMVRAAREQIASFAGVLPKEIIFTSGGTESNNTAIFGACHLMRHRGRKIITLATEHPSVLRCVEQLEQEGYEVLYIPVDAFGRPDLAEFEKMLTPDVALVTCAHVNSELGTITPVAEMRKLLKRHKCPAIFHIDGVQSFARAGFLEAVSAGDLISFSGHKIHGPKGIGGLVVKNGIKLPPRMLGGGQEQGLRSGTENVPGILGLAEACRIWKEEGEEKIAHIRSLKDALYAALCQRIPSLLCNSPEDGAPYILNCSFLGTKSEVLIRLLEQEGIFVSPGSACSSKSGAISHVLKAVGMDKKRADSALRFSLSDTNTPEEIEPVADAVFRAVSFMTKGK